MLSERSCCANTGSAEPRRKRRDTATKHPRHTPAASLWTPRNRTAAAVLTGLPPGPALLPATPTGAPCWAAAQTCPHPRRKIPRRCAAATTGNSEHPESMDSRHHTGARRRGAPQTRRSSRLLNRHITGARKRRAPRTRGSSRLHPKNRRVVGDGSVIRRTFAPLRRASFRLCGKGHFIGQDRKSSRAMRGLSSPRCAWTGKDRRVVGDGSVIRRTFAPLRAASFRLSGPGHFCGQDRKSSRAMRGLW